MTGVYAIRHIASQRVYVGSSADIHKRWAVHVRSLERGRHGSRYLQHAWTKYGSAAFEFVVLEVCMPEERIEREQAYIDRYHAADPAFGFNLSATAGLTTLNAESRAKLAESVSRAMKGRTFGPRRPEVGRKIAASLRGRPLSEERKRKIGESNRGKIKGVPKSPEHRAKIAAASARYRHSTDTKMKMRESRRKLFQSERGAELRATLSQAKRTFYQTEAGARARERLAVAAMVQAERKAQRKEAAECLRKSNETGEAA